jgi:septal ring factor EnvC (AmiA/AmiB activator)
MNEEKLKGYFSKKNCIIVACIIVTIITSCWLCCRYYEQSARTDGNDATVTIQQIETNNRTARDDISQSQNINQSIGTELDSGQEDISGAKQSTKQLSNSLDERKELIDTAKQQIGRSEQLVTEERGIFADVDEANKITGTQTSSN